LFVFVLRVVAQANFAGKYFFSGRPFAIFPNECSSHTGGTGVGGGVRGERRGMAGTLRIRSSRNRGTMFNHWLSLGLKAFQVGLEAQSVIALRMLLGEGHRDAVIAKAHSSLIRR
jgi:hypothetical protein